VGSSQIVAPAKYEATAVLIVKLVPSDVQVTLLGEGFRSIDKGEGLFCRQATIATAANNMRINFFIGYRY
jgi:hypothetical protein